MPVKVALSQYQYVNGLICLFHEAVASQRRAVALAAGGVEPPVFGYPEGGVVPALSGVVFLACAFRCYFQHEIGRLALVAY